MSEPPKDGGSRGGAETRTWPSTLWDLIQRSRDGPADERKRSLDDLFHRYYKPVFRFFQKALRVDARHVEDLTQDFFTRFIEKDFLRSVREEKSFRGFLKVACRRHFFNWLEAQAAAKRGTDRIVPLENPGAAMTEAQIDGMIDEELRTWYLETAVERARKELTAQGKETYFKVFEARAGLRDGAPADYKALSDEFAIPVYDVGNYLLASRRIFRQALVDLAAERSPDPMEELRELGLSPYLS